MSGRGMAKEQVSELFRQASHVDIRSGRAKPTYPFSLRFTVEERAYLEKQAGRKPLGTYMRERLLESHADERRIIRKPTVDDEKITSVLHQLGQSRLPSNLNQLAKAANTGTLDVSQDIEQQLQEAYGAVLAMRDALFMALGLKPEDCR